jgi:hypothetical protein
MANIDRSVLTLRFKLIMLSERIIDLLLKYSLIVLFGLGVFYLALRRFKNLKTVQADPTTVKKRAAMYFSGWAEAA